MRIPIRETIISGEVRTENLEKMGNNRDIYCYANRVVANFERQYQPLPPWYQNACDVSIFPHARPNFRENLKKLNFQANI